LHGERETGATLHVMVAAPDAGAIVAREAVPILPDDTAIEVFHKVTVAAELALDKSLPALLSGGAPHLPQDLAAGSYFGRRTAHDGIIDWSRGAMAAHNLIRAVAPPYPGAFARAQGMRLRILRSLPRSEALTAASPQLRWQDGELLVLCHDGALRLLEFELGDDIRSPLAFYRTFGTRSVPLEPVPEAA
jgi:methionyl-tRNA formyltransferase